MNEKITNFKILHIMIWRWFEQGHDESLAWIWGFFIESYIYLLS